METSAEFLNKLIETAKKSGADAADAICFDNISVSASTRLGKIENIEQANSKGFGLRVIIDQKQAIVSSTDMSSNSVNNLVEQAIAMAKLAPKDPYLTLADKELQVQEPLDLNLFDDSIIQTEDLIDCAKEAENAALKVNGITNSEGANSSFSKSSITLSTSNDFVKTYKTSSYNISVSVISGSHLNMQTDYEFSSKRFFKDLDSPSNIGLMAANRALKKLNPKKIASQELPIIFDPRVAKTLLANFASAINGATIAKGVSFLANKLHEQVFSNNINIIDDPKILKGMNSRPFDAEGLEGSKKYLVKDGILNNYLLDLRSAKQLNLKPTANAVRGLSSNPAPSSSNLYLENGDVSPTDLLSATKKGLYITDLFGMGINIVTGDYSQGAFGFLIENGELTYPVSEITIAGNLQEMFQNITACNDLEFKYGTNSPTILVNKMTVAGV
ncbi:MAG: TldD/PmbA family protein [Alphaproteobacteria bacterium]